MEGVFFKDMPEPSDYEDNQDSDLSSIFDLQRDLMEACETGRLPRDYGFMLTAHNLVQEVGEALRPYGNATQPGKQEDELALPLTDMQEEWVDILFFWVQGAIQLGMTGNDVYDKYVEKNVKNFERIKAKKGANK